MKKPEILIFDDSFSALDFKTDSMLRKAVKGTHVKRNRHSGRSKSEYNHECRTNSRVR